MTAATRVKPRTPSASPLSDDPQTEAAAQAQPQSKPKPAAAAKPLPRPQQQAAPTKSGLEALETDDPPQSQPETAAQPPATQAEAQPEAVPGEGLTQPVATGLGDMPYEPPRQERVPFGTQIPKLTVVATPGFTPRWFNDVPGRIARAYKAGYRHIVDTRGENISIVVGTKEFGGGLTAYAMEIPTEIYDEDFALKQQSLDEIDMSMMAGLNRQAAGDGRYTPVDPYTRRPKSAASVIRGREPFGPRE